MRCSMLAMRWSKYRPNAESEELSRSKRPWLLARLAARELLDPPPPNAAWPWRSSWTSSALRPSWVSGTAWVDIAGSRSRGATARGGGEGRGQEDRAAGRDGAGGGGYGR